MSDDVFSGVRPLESRTPKKQANKQKNLFLSTETGLELERRKGYLGSKE